MNRVLLSLLGSGDIGYSPDRQKLPSLIGCNMFDLVMLHGAFFIKVCHFDIQSRISNNLLSDIFSMPSVGIPLIPHIDNKSI